MFELKESDLPELERLDELGYRWVARDEDGGVYAYDSVPTRGSISWTGRGCYRQIGLGRDSKIGVSWSDPEPLNIAAAIAQIKAGKEDETHE